MPQQLPALTIRNFTVQIPIVQGGMGVGVSWDDLAGAVARAGAMGTVSSVGTGYWNTRSIRTINGRPLKPVNFHNSENLKAIIRSAKEKSQGHGAVGVNILCAVTDYERQVRDSVEAGAQYIISGAGLPLRLPEYVGKADVALIPIVSSPRVVDLLCKRWKRHGRLPDAIVLEGPKSGGHQGFTYEQCLDPAYRLEVLTPAVLKTCKAWGNIPLIVAGGIWDRKDIDRYMDLGVAAVQMATRFIGTYECDASDLFKRVLIASQKNDIKLIKSPVGYPARGLVTTPLIQRVQSGVRPKIPCISNCIDPCDHGTESNKVGYCIADALGDAQKGVYETGLFFSGSNGYRIMRLQSVQDIIDKLTGVKVDDDTWPETDAGDMDAAMTDLAVNTG